MQKATFGRVTRKLVHKNADGAAAKMIANEFDPDARKRRRKNAHAEPKDDDDEEEEEEEDD